MSPRVPGEMGSEQFDRRITRRLFFSLLISLCFLVSSSICVNIKHLLDEAERNIQNYHAFEIDIDTIDLASMKNFILVEAESK